MKFLFVTLTVLLSVFNSKSYAEELKVSTVVLKSFKNSFETAAEVKWSYNENMYKAEFSYNSQYVAAFYDENGYLVAITKNITSSQLPLTLQTSLKNQSEKMWISDLFEVSNEGGTTYYVTLEDADTKIVMKSAGTAGWSVFQKQKKS